MKHVNLLVGLTLLGVVDQVHEQNVHAEVSGMDGVTVAVDLPLWLFPCEIAEGDWFYFTKSTGVLELRCGKPPE